MEHQAGKASTDICHPPAFKTYIFAEQAPTNLICVRSVSTVDLSQSL